MKTILTLAFGTLLAASAAAAEPIRHRFLAVDESRQKLHYVDESDPAKDWSIPFTARYRDLQLIGGNRVMVSTPDGYREYSLTDRQLVKEVKGFPGGVSFRRLLDGRTVLATNGKGVVTFFELDPSDKVLRKATFEVPGTRVIRLTTRGTVLFGSTNRLFEGSLDGKTIRTIELEKGAWVYQALEKQNGNLLVAAGYVPVFLELDQTGKELRRFGGKTTDEGKTLGLNFFAGFQVLKNGNVVIANWTGHGADDSKKGTQIVEFDSKGQLVWKWHKPDQAGSINGVIVLDDLDPAVWNSDATSVLGPLK